MGGLKGGYCCVFGGVAGVGGWRVLGVERSRLDTEKKGKKVGGNLGFRVVLKVFLCYFYFGGGGGGG